MPKRTMPSNLVGLRFGRLTVIARAEDYISPSGKSKTTRWLCRCDCGKEVTMMRTHVLAAKSCGCIRNEKSSARRLDLTGQTFGRLTVIKSALLPKPTPSGQKTGWLCRCECGTEKVLPRDTLIAGKTVSCGCAQIERRQSSIAHFDGTTISKITKSNAMPNSGTGVRGVYYDRRKQAYVARIGLRRKTIHLGTFKSLEAAKAARKAAEAEYYAPIIEAYEAEKNRKK